MLIIACYICPDGLTHSCNLASPTLIVTLYIRVTKGCYSTTAPTQKKNQKEKKRKPSPAPFFPHTQINSISISLCLSFFLSLIPVMKRPHSPVSNPQPSKHLRTAYECTNDFMDSTHNSQVFGHQQWGPNPILIPSEPINTACLDIRMPQPLRHRVRIDDIDEYLAQHESSDSDEEDSRTTYVGDNMRGSVIQGNDDIHLVDAHVNGAFLPMQRRSGETKLRIPDFVLQNKPDPPTKPNGRDLILYQQPSWKSLVEANCSSPTTTDSQIECCMEVDERLNQASHPADAMEID
ncbi:hypothetical protein CLU79DRAFT_286949 [Phycomyces nitens]|nr:hypothetical protein CLU79DRAFT_286949 [Phycomyces nitens]